MLYQWGRKDPFPNTHNVFKDGKGTEAKMIDIWKPVDYKETGENNDANIQYSIEHPAVFITSTNTAAPNMQSWMTVPDMSLWGDPNGFIVDYQKGGWSADKTIYDPCPAGYRVANLYTVSGFTTTGANSSNREEFNVLNESWGSGPTGYWIFRMSKNDEVGVYWPNTASRNPGTGNVERGTQAEHWFSHTTGGSGNKARCSQVYETAVNIKTTSANTAYGHALRCVRYE